MPFPLTGHSKTLISRMQRLHFPVSTSGVCLGYATAGADLLIKRKLDVFEASIKLICSMEDKQIKLALRRTKGNADMIDVLAILTNIQLHQSPTSHLALFKRKKINVRQDYKTVWPILSSKTKPVAVVTDDIDGVYTLEKLKTYFELIRAELKNPHSILTDPVALLLKNLGHALTVGYDPKNDEWQFIEANTKNVQRMPGSEITQLAKNVIQRFEYPEGNIQDEDSVATAFHTTIMASTLEQESVIACINSCRQRLAWQGVHRVTSENVHDSSKSNHTRLHLAVRYYDDNNNTVDDLLNFGVDINKKDKYGCDALSFAVHRVNIKMVRLLLQRGAENLDLALLSAICVGSIHIAQLLLKNGAVLDKNIALILAAQTSNLNMVKFIERLGCDINKKIHIEPDEKHSFQGNPDDLPIHYAFREGEPTIARYFLNHPNIILTQATKNQLLLIAAEKGEVKLLAALLDKGAEINAVTGNSKGKVTAMHIAVRNQDQALLKFLLDKGANPDLENVWARSPLDDAVSLGDVEATKLFLANKKLQDNFPYYIALAIKSGSVETLDLLAKHYGGNIESVVDKTTALHDAAGSGSLEMVKLCLRLGCDINRDVYSDSVEDLYDEPSENITPLDEAVKSGHFAVAEHLLNHKDIRPDSDTKIRLLSLAAKTGNIKLVALVLEKGADIHSEYNYTLFTAIENEDHAMLTYLLKVGSDPNKMRLERKTPLSTAAAMGDMESVNILLASANIKPDFNKELKSALQGLNIEIVKLFLGLGGKFEFASPAELQQIFHEAVKSDVVEIVEILLANEKIDINAKHKADSSALEIALMHGNASMVKLLLANGADQTILSDNFQREYKNLICYSARLGNEEIFNMLLSDEKFPCHFKDNEMHFAVQGGNVDIINKLIEKGAPIDVQNEKGETALVLAEKRGAKKIIERLLSVGDKVHLRK